MGIYIVILGWADGSTQVTFSAFPVNVDGETHLVCEEYVPSEPDEEPILRILEALLAFPGDDASSMESQLVPLLTRAAELYHEVLQKQRKVTVTAE